MAEPEARSLDIPDDTRSFEHGTVQTVRLGAVTIGRVRFEPGFRWSSDLKPTVGGESCMIHHKGYAISGRLRVRMEDGTELEIKGGDAHEVPPGHDGWVVGDEPYIALDFSEDISSFAKPA
ncbi:MAG: cupin domain-containing protein [Actinobacteria bacterium]|nr:cupin domain-containing protein [Actinomycetota bacterium]